MAQRNQMFLRFIATAIASIMFLNVIQSTTSLPLQPATPVGIKAFRQFHANDSLIGTPIPCTKEEKLCFRYNVLFAPKHNVCLPVSYDTCEFAGNRHEFFNGSHRLFASCPGYYDPCPGYRMAYDNRCYPKAMVRDYICGCDAKPTDHFLGGVECRCSPPTPLYVQQPEEDGKCLIPDLRFPDHRQRYLEISIPVEWNKLLGDGSLNCSADQARCFSEGKVWVAEGRGCFPLRERGPCPAEHVVVLDAQAALRGHAEAVCVHQRGGCPPGQRRMAVDQCCYHDADLDVIRTGQLYFTEFGNHVVTGSFHSGRTVTLVRSKYNHTNHNMCLIERSISESAGQVHYGKPPCGDNDQGKCNLYEVENQLPKPSGK